MFCHIDEKIIIQWSEGLEIRREHLTLDEVVNIPPWIVDKVIIGIEDLEGSLHDIYLWKHQQYEKKKWLK